MNLLNAIKMIVEYDITVFVCVSTQDVHVHVDVQLDMHHRGY